MSQSRKWVSRGVPKTEQEHAAHRTSVEAAWAAYQANKTRSLARNKNPCVHRGKRVSASDAYGPKGVECCKLYECKLHSLCAIKRLLPDIACCAQCGDYETKT